MRGCINCYGEINTFVTCVLGWFTTEQVKKKHSQIRWQVYSSYVIKKITPGLAVDLISAAEGTQTSRMGNHSIFWTLITNVSGFSGSFTAESGFFSWEATRHCRDQLVLNHQHADPQLPIQSPLRQPDDHASTQTSVKCKLHHVHIERHLFNLIQESQRGFLGCHTCQRTVNKAYWISLITIPHSAKFSFPFQYMPSEYCSSYCRSLLG